MKRRPGCPDTIFDFGRFLMLECNQLSQVSHAFTSCQDFNFDIADLHFFFRVRTYAALVAENFRLSWVDPESHFFSTFLEFVQHFLASLDVANSSTFLRFVRQSVLVAVDVANSAHVVGEPQCL